MHSPQEWEYRLQDLSNQCNLLCAAMSVNDPDRVLDVYEAHATLMQALTTTIEQWEIAKRALTTVPEDQDPVQRLDVIMGEIRQAVSTITSRLKEVQHFFLAESSHLRSGRQFVGEQYAGPKGSRLNTRF